MLSKLQQAGIMMSQKFDHRICIRVKQVAGAIRLTLLGRKRFQSISRKDDAQVRLDRYSEAPGPAFSLQSVLASTKMSHVPKTCG